MMKITPHTDLTNPEKYDEVMNHRNQMVLVERPYDRQMCGTIFTTAYQFSVVFEETGKYFIEDKYGNQIYLGIWKNRQRVFDFYAQNKVQLCRNFDDMRVLVKSFFKRK